MLLYDNLYSPKRSPIDNTFYIVNTNLVIKEYPATPKVFEYAYTFKRDKITYLNSMSFFPCILDSSNKRA